MNPDARQPRIAWPGWPHLRYTALLGLAVTVWFGIIYGGMDWITAHRSFRVRVHFDAELQVPFVPAFTPAYLSIYLIFLAVPFILRTRAAVNILAVRLAAAIALAGVVFLLVPARLAFPPPEIAGFWAPLFRFADWINLDHNLVPSLHVALSVICLEAFAAQAARPGRVALRCWGWLIAASTLFLHQHHVLDVVAGYVLAWGASRWRRVPRDETQ